jgi:hypothetical protein
MRRACAIDPGGIDVLASSLDEFRAALTAQDLSQEQERPVTRLPELKP